MAYALKSAGKLVTYNDVLQFNYLIGLPLIENSSQHFEPREVDNLLDFDRVKAQPASFQVRFRASITLTRRTDGSTVSFPGFAPFRMS